MTLPGLPRPWTALRSRPRGPPPTPAWAPRRPQSLGKPAHGRRFPTAPTGPSSWSWDGYGQRQRPACFRPSATVSNSGHAARPWSKILKRAWSKHLKTDIPESRVARARSAPSALAAWSFARQPAAPLASTNGWWRRAPVTGNAGGIWLAQRINLLQQDFFTSCVAVTPVFSVASRWHDASSRAGTRRCRDASPVAVRDYRPHPTAQLHDPQHATPVGETPADRSGRRV